LPPAGIGALVVAAGVLTAAIAWQAAIAQKPAMMSLVWIFTGSPFIRMSIEGAPQRAPVRLESFPSFPEYIIPARQWRCFFGPRRADSTALGKRLQTS
jgi:hypothetical protein